MILLLKTSPSTYLKIKKIKEPKVDPFHFTFHFHFSLHNHGGRRSIAGTAQATLPHQPRPTLSPRTSALSLGGGDSRANVRGESVGLGWWGRVA